MWSPDGSFASGWPRHFARATTPAGSEAAVDELIRLVDGETLPAAASSGAPKVSLGQLPAEAWALLVAFIYGSLAGVLLSARAALALAARRGAALLAAGHAGRRFRRMDERAAGRSAVHAGRRRDLRRAVDGAPGLLPGDRRTGLCSPARAGGALVQRGVLHLRPAVAGRGADAGGSLLVELPPDALAMARAAEKFPPPTVGVAGGLPAARIAVRWPGRTAGLAGPATVPAHARAAGVRPGTPEWGGSSGSSGGGSSSSSSSSSGGFSGGGGSSGGGGASGSW